MQVGYSSPAESGIIDDLGLTTEQASFKTRFIFFISLLSFSLLIFQRTFSNLPFNTCFECTNYVFDIKNVYIFKDCFFRFFYRNLIILRLWHQATHQFLLEAYFITEMIFHFWGSLKHGGCLLGPVIIKINFIFFKK